MSRVYIWLQTIALSNPFPRAACCCWAKTSDRSSAPPARRPLRAQEEGEEEAMEEDQEEAGGAGPAASQGNMENGGGKAKLQNMKTAKLLKLMVKSLLRCFSRSARYHQLFGGCLPGSSGQPHLRGNRGPDEGLLAAGPTGQEQSGQPAPVGLHWARWMPW